MEKELKPIRYQSETYSKVTSVINRVNVASLWDAHEHQKRGKAVGIDGVDKETYEEGLVEKLIELVNRMKLLKYIHVHSESQWQATAVGYSIIRRQIGSIRHGGCAERNLRATIPSTSFVKYID